jgi:hypothetical protein
VKDKTLLELVDGAYELVFVYKPSSPAQEAWKRNWLEKARLAGAGPDDMPMKKDTKTGKDARKVKIT